MNSSTDIDVGNQRRPFSELSAKMLYRALKDVEKAMNCAEFKTLWLSGRYHYRLWRLEEGRRRLRT